MRDKIERRYANAIGSAELAQNSVQGRMLEVQQASVQTLLQPTAIGNQPLATSGSLGTRFNALA